MIADELNRLNEILAMRPWPNEGAESFLARFRTELCKFRIEFTPKVTTPSGVLYGEQTTGYMGRQQ